MVDLVVDGAEREQLVSESVDLPSLQLSDRAVCDLELLANGGFSPLDRFMSRADHDRVVAEMRLDNGTLFPIPIALPVDRFEGLALDRKIALRDSHNDILAVMTVEEIYEWSRDEVAQNVLGTRDTRHPLVAQMQHWGPLNISGKLEVLSLPKHRDFIDLRLTPAQTRERLSSLGRENIVAFQTRNPIHRVHEEMTKLAAEKIDGTIFIHPAVGMTKPGDVDYFTRVRTYR